MKTMKLSYLAIPFAFAFGLNSCIDDFKVIGNGHVASETRSTSYFDEVKSNGSFEVYITPGDDYLVEVNAETNLIPYIITEVDNNKLKIRTQGLHNLHNTRPMKIYVTTPHLNGITLSGSGYIETDHFAANKFDINLSGSGTIDTSIDVDELEAGISGSGKIKISGNCDQSKYIISGSGNIQSYDLEQHLCRASISGSGDIFANVSDAIDVNISGSGNFYFINTPDVHSSISGSGKIINDN